MKKILSFLLLPIFSASIAYADFLDGKLAYEVGNYEAAHTEFLQAVNQEEDPAQAADALYHLGWMYENGLGVETNPDTALSYYQQAANKGQDQAQFALGYAYGTGSLGLTRSPIDSLSWYAKSANDGGNKDASYNLGVAYLNGIGEIIRPNPALSRSWFQKGANLGSVESIYALAAIYYEGNGVEKDIPKSMELLRQATLMGFGQAAFYLAQLYDNQKPVSNENKKQAYYYYIVAQNLGFSAPSLPEKINELTLNMEQQDIESVQVKLAKEAKDANNRKQQALEQYRNTDN